MLADQVEGADKVRGRQALKDDAEEGRRQGQQRRGRNSSSGGDRGHDNEMPWVLVQGESSCVGMRVLRVL